MNRLLTVFFVMACVISLSAQAPFQKTQAPGYFRMNLGEWEITAIQDGSMELSTKYLQNCEPKDISKYHERAFLPPETESASLNVFIINTGLHLILVDAGTAGLFGPACGKLPDNLKLAGYRPEQIDAIFITHFHDDHTAGLVDSTGKKIFSNAVLFISKQGAADLANLDSLKSVSTGYKRELASINDMFKPYKESGKLKTFDDEQEIFPGIRALYKPGHAIGNCAFEFRSSGQKLLLWGDIVHFPSVQFHRPDASVKFDTDSKLAVKTRISLFKKVSAEKTLIASSHIPFPGLGRVRDEGKGHYEWIPVLFEPVK